MYPNGEILSRNNFRKGRVPFRSEILSGVKKGSFVPFTLEKYKKGVYNHVQEKTGKRSVGYGHGAGAERPGVRGGGSLRRMHFRPLQICLTTIPILKLSW